MPRFVFLLFIALTPGLLSLAVPAAAAGEAARGSGPIAENFSEGFDDILELPGKGWVQRNNSQPQGSVGWAQGDPGEFSAHLGPADSYISANWANADGLGTVSNWLLTPEIALSSETRVRFWTRTADPNGQPFPDRLEVRLSTDGASDNVGGTAESVGSFTTVLLTINPDLQDEYPTVWTEYVITLDMIAEPTSGRIAFRYYVTDSGPFGDNGDFIGIDTFSVTQPHDAPDDEVIFADRFEEFDGG